MKLNNNGTTMVEITVGFLLLVILFISFIKIIDLSSEMTKYSIDIKEKNVEFEKMYYGIDNNSIVDSAFRNKEGMKIQDPNDSSKELSIKICEWTPTSDGYFLEWHYDNSSGKFVDVSVADNLYLPLNNLRIKRLENILGESASKMQIFKYVYETPLITEQ